MVLGAEALFDLRFGGQPVLNLVSGFEAAALRAKVRYLGNHFLA
jgi:hypothetical protein